MATRIRTRRQRAARASDSGHSLFGGTGWLFADLMLAIAMAFLVATTVGTTPAPPPRPHVTATPTHRPTPSPTSSKQPQPLPLDLKYVTLTLTINPNAVLSVNPAATQAIRRAILADPRLKGRRAGLVILFGGGDVSSPEWGQLDNKTWTILTGMGDVTDLFKVAVPRKFWGGGPLTRLELNIYLFKTS